MPLCEDDFRTENYSFNSELWTQWLETNRVLALWHEKKVLAETNSAAAARSSRNGHLSVRQWFREMRAADFERDVAFKSKSLCGSFFVVQPELISWTLFDTQQVVDRETARTYDVFARSVIPWFRSQVVGESRPITFADLEGWARRPARSWTHAVVTPCGCRGCTDARHLAQLKDGDWE